MLGKAYMEKKSKADHDLEPVIHYDWPDGWGGRTVPKKEPSGHFYCKKCKLMGNLNTFLFYGCNPQAEPEWKTCKCAACRIQRTFRS